MLKYACVHFYKEGNQYDILESAKLEKVGDEYIAEWKEKKYPVTVLGFGGEFLAFSVFTFDFNLI